jgi:hypothetical protein
MDRHATLTFVVGTVCPDQARDTDHHDTFAAVRDVLVATVSSTADQPPPAGSRQLLIDHTQATSEVSP